MLELIAHSLPCDKKRLAVDVVVATITTDKTFLGNLSARHQLKRIADAMGLHVYSIKGEGGQLEHDGPQASLVLEVKS